MSAAPDLDDPHSPSLIPLLLDASPEGWPLVSLAGLTLLGLALCALAALSEAAVATLARRGRKERPLLSDLADALVDRPRETLAGLLLLHTAGLAVAVAAGCTLLLRWLPEEGRVWFGLAGVAAGTMALALFADLGPRALGHQLAGRALNSLAPALGPVLGLLTPLRLLTVPVADLLVRLTGGQGTLTNLWARERLHLAAIAHGGPGEMLERAERDLIERILAVESMDAKDVMIPRTEIRMANVAQDRETVAGIFREIGHSRLLVCGESQDQVIGFLHRREFLLRPDREWTDLIREPLRIPPAMDLLTLLDQFQTSRALLAVVVDEYGGTEGLVSLNVLIQAVMGESTEGQSNGGENGHDEAPAEPVRQDGESSWVVWGRTELRDLNEVLPAELDEERARTLSGYVVNTLGRIPEEGEALHEAEFQFEVRRMDGPTIEEVVIRWRSGGGDSPGEVTA